MPELVIDVGNTRTKIALFENGIITQSSAAPGLAPEYLKRLHKKFSPSATIISSVIELNKEIYEEIKVFSNVLFFDHQTPLPLKNCYSTSETLGLDRLANAVAARNLFPEKNTLIIDAGTCLKTDFVNLKGEYLGGAISPGLQMRYMALHKFTDKLPLLSMEESFSLTGNSTAGSIHSGVLNGILFEAQQFISGYEALYPDLQIVITGGDHRFFLNHLKKTIFAHPDLTLVGLCTVLKFNKAQ